MGLGFESLIVHQTRNTHRVFFCLRIGTRTRKRVRKTAGFLWCKPSSLIVHQTRNTHRVFFCLWIGTRTRKRVRKTAGFLWRKPSPLIVHQVHAFMQKIVHKRVFFFVFLYKYLVAWVIFSLLFAVLGQDLGQISFLYHTNFSPSFSKYSSDKSEYALLSFPLL